MTARRTRGFAISLLALALSVGVACGGDEDDPGVASAEEGSGTTGADAGDEGGEAAEPDGLAFTGCMRDHGVAMEDPDPATGVPQFEPGAADPESPAFQEAMEACQGLVPEGGIRGEGDGVDVEQFQAFAECMRANGMPDFPDPQPGGEGVFGDAGIDRESPAFQQASEACSDVLAGATGGSTP